MSHAKKAELSYFKLDMKELKNALHILESLPSDLAVYDISYEYDDNLDEVPRKPKEMNAYAEILISRARVEFEKDEATRDWLQLTKSFGMAGSLKKMIGKFDSAERLLNDAIILVENRGLSQVYHIQQSIRLYDLYKKTKRPQEALTGLRAIVQSCSTDATLVYYLDVAAQHLGKVHFSLGQYEEALAAFEKALQLRLEKKDQELITSTQTAIKACQSRIKKRG